MLMDVSGTYIGWLVATISDNKLRRIYRTDPYTLSTVASGVSGGLDHHKSSKQHFVAHQSAHQIKKLVWNAGSMSLDSSVLAGTGTSGDADGIATSATLNAPFTIAVYAKSDVTLTAMFITFCTSTAIRRLAPVTTSGTVSTVVTGQTGSGYYTSGISIYEGSSSSTMVWMQVGGTGATTTGLYAVHGMTTSSATAASLSPTSVGTSDCFSSSSHHLTFSSSGTIMGVSSNSIDIPDQSPCWCKIRSDCATTAAPSGNSTSSSSLSTGAIIGIAVGGGAAVIIVATALIPYYCCGMGVFFCLCKKKSSDKDDEDDEDEQEEKEGRNISKKTASQRKSAYDADNVADTSPTAVIPMRAMMTDSEEACSLINAAAVVASVALGETDATEAVRLLEQESSSSSSSSSFNNNKSGGSANVEHWIATLRSLPPDDVDDLRDGAATSFCHGAATVFQALETAPFPISTLCAGLGGIFTLAKRSQVNKFECQLLAHRTSRLLPILIRASQTNITAAQGVFSEMNTVLNRCVAVVEEFVPPEAKPDADPEAWFGQRLFKWIQHKAAVFSSNAVRHFEECHQRLDRVIRETALAAQLDVHSDIKDVKRSLAEIKSSCDQGLQSALDELRKQMEVALTTATASVAAEIKSSQTSLATMFSRVEAKIDRVSDKITNMFRALIKEKEFSSLEISPDRVQIDEDVVLGVGGFGCVFKGTLDHSVPIAAKVALVEDDSEARAILREAKLANRLTNPGIVMCLGITTKLLKKGSSSSSPRVLLLMERCQCSLGALVEASASEGAGGGGGGGGGGVPLSFAEPFHCLGTICSGLVELHNRGLVHRDVKPHNMLLSREHCKLSDLGSVKAERAARLLQQHQTTSATAATRMTTKTTTGNVGSAGTTLAFVAPELVRSDNARATPKADVYSLGASIYQLVTLESPYQVTADDFPETWPDQLRDLVKSCISSKPANRPDMAEVARRVRELSVETFPLSEDECDSLIRRARKIAKSIEARPPPPPTEPGSINTAS